MAPRHETSSSEGNTIRDQTTEKGPIGRDQLPSPPADRGARNTPHAPQGPLFGYMKSLIMAMTSAFQAVII
ncbi:hypothetical protein V6N12_009404 [Hibiscus sabdariffa]|uniref:Uncharacterized protein n=1 Tax=Hibiscus sabdariffa TaxID=183260 RepID=A0ABR2EAK6_9ROSI